MLIFHFQSLSAFLEYNVVTINFIKYENNLQFPSLTLCRVYNGSAIFDNANVINCTFNLKSCDHLIDTLIVNAREGYRKCMRFNGKKKSSSKIITTSARFGYRFGLRLSFIHEKGQRTFAYIGDNFDLPVDGEFYNYLDAGKRNEIILEKYVNTNLGYPFSNCIAKEDNIDSELYKETIDLENNYRKTNCESLCFYKHYTNYCNCSLPDLNHVFVKVNVITYSLKN